MMNDENLPDILRTDVDLEAIMDEVGVDDNSITEILETVELYGDDEDIMDDDTDITVADLEKIWDLN